MRKILITGGAGFIGSALVRYIINETSDAVVVVDKLTYAGNLMSLAPVAQSERFAFEKVVCFYAREHSVVIRLGGEKKQQIYMCIQDDGYSEGSREELFALLRQKGIAQQ